MSGLIAAIVPVKRLTEAKQRLAPALAPDQRRQLVLTMLDEVLETLARVDGIWTRIVVTADVEIVRSVSRHHATVAQEHGSHGLNAAVRTGLRKAARLGARVGLVIPADVPLATADEIGAVIDKGAGAKRSVTLVPSRDGNGTNALMLAPLDAIPPDYGQGSFVRHLASAVARRLDTQVLQLPGLGLDIDEPADLERLWQQRRHAARYGFLAPVLAAADARYAGQGVRNDV